MTPKLIATDLDGTLLQDDKRLSPANRLSLEHAAAQGCQVVPATGRMLHAIPQVLLDLPFLRFFILMNGAQVLDRKTGHVLYRCEIPTNIALEIFYLLKSANCTVDCFQNDQGWMERRYYDHLEDYISDPAARSLTRHSRIPVEDLSQAIRSGGSTVQKIQMYFPQLEERAQVSSLLHQKFPQLLQSISMPGNLELNAPGADKGTALRSLCQSLTIDPLETIAFGDGTNDISMLQAAGIGVAMANAAPETLSAADRIAPSNQEDGVAQILNRLLAL